MPRPRTPKGYYTTSQVKTILNVSDADVRMFVTQGKITYHLPPGKTQGFYLQTEVDALALERGLPVLVETKDAMESTSANAAKRDVAFLWLDDVFLNQGDGPIERIEYTTVDNGDGSAPAFIVWYKSRQYSQWTQRFAYRNAANVEQYRKRKEYDDDSPYSLRMTAEAIQDAKTYEHVRVWIGEHLSETVVDRGIPASCLECGAFYAGLEKYCKECRIAKGEA